MTIHEAIEQTDHLKPNMYEEGDKIRWLSRLDGRIFEEIVCTHTFNDGETEITEFNGYTLDDGETELLVGAPWDELYVLWLQAQIDYSNMEYDSFNNTNAMFESVFSGFRNAYNRSHKPKGTGKTYY